MELPVLEGRRQDPSDEVCIRNFCRLNDEAAFNCLVNRYAKSIRRIIYTVIRDPKEDIEDVEQEVLLALYNSLPKFSFRSSFSTYLFRMCRNKAIDFARKRKRNFTVNGRILENQETADSNTPETLYINEITKTNILNAVFQLKERDRSLIIMKDVENLSIDEIAGIFQKPTGTIKSRLHRARKKAAEKILEEELK
jgi:RNA polymerase sigma-70 factor, ECF subfamily